MKKVLPVLILIILAGIWWLSRGDLDLPSQDQIPSRPESNIQTSRTQTVTRSLSVSNDQEYVLECVGKVIDLASGNPIDGASVWLDGHETERVFTAEDGVYRLVFDQPVLNGDIIASASGFEPQRKSFQMGKGKIRGPSFTLRMMDGSIHGKVTGLGKPLVGATVYVDLLNVNQLLQVDTDSNGEFRMEVPSGVLFGLDAEKKGWIRTGRLNTTSVEPGESRDVHINLTPRPSLTGRLISPTGAPLADMDIELHIYKRRKPPITARSDVDGRFLFSYLAPNRYRLRAGGLGFAGSIEDLQITGEPSLVDLGDIRLQSAVSLEGFVFDASGRGVEDAQVWRLQELSATPSLEFTRDPPNWPAQVITDEDGRFVLDNLYPQEIIIAEVRHPRHLPAWAKHEVGGESLEIHLKQAGEISGRVVNQQGQPIGAGQIKLDWKRRNTRSSWKTTEIQPDGTFQIGGLPLGGHRLRVISPGYAITASPDIVLSADRPYKSITLALEPEMVLQGRVSDQDGEPIPDAYVYPAIIGRNSGQRIYGNIDDPLAGVTTITDTTGFYRLTNLPAGDHPYRAEKEGYQSLAKSIEQQPGLQNLDFVLESDSPTTFSVSGKVLDHQGRAISGVDLNLSMRHSGRYWTGTDDTGVFVFENVKEGEYFLGMIKHGWYAERDPAPIKVHQPIEDIVLRLKPTHLISGTIVGLDPQYHKSVKIKAFRSIRSSSEGKADASGHYQIKGLTPGEWVVSASVDATGEYAKETVFISPDQPVVNLDLNLRRGFTFSATVTKAPLMGPRVPAAGYRLILSSKYSARNLSGFLDDNGDIQFSGLPPGEYVLSIIKSSQGFQYSDLIQLDKDIHKNIQLTLGSISGQVIDSETGDPLEGVMVSINNQGTSDYHTDDQGHFYIGNLPMINYRTMLVKSGYTHYPINLVLDETEPSIEVVLEMSLSRKLDLNFTRAGQPFLNRVHLSVLSASGHSVLPNSQIDGVPDQNGAIRIDSIPPGEFLVFAKSGDDLFSLSYGANPEKGPVGMVMQKAGQLRFQIPGMEDRFKRIYLTSAKGWTISFFGRVSNESILFSNMPTGLWTWQMEHQQQEFQGQITIKAGEENKVLIQL